MHAASVGEVRAAAPLVGELLRQRPAARILVSTFTASGRRIAARTLADGEPRVRCLLLPLDWAWIPARVIRRERPALFILLETELWPVLLTALRGARVPVLIANGRISPRSFGRYLLAAPRAAPRARGGHAGVGAHGRRRQALPGDRSPRLPGPRRGESQARPPAGRGPGGRASSGGDPRAPVAAVPGARCSSRAACAAPRATWCSRPFAACAAVEPALLLVLAPRHPERFDAGKLNAWSGSWVRWSAAPREIDPGTAVVLLDTLGELADFYAAADVACVGGTWGDHGGHNLLEPALSRRAGRLRAGHPSCRGRGPGAAGRRRRFSGRRCRPGSSSAAGGCSPTAARAPPPAAARSRLRRAFSGAVETVARAAIEILDERRRTP